MAFRYLLEAETEDKHGNPIGVRFDCTNCTDEDKKARGCEGGVKWYFDELVIDHCPERLIDADTLHNIGIWKRYHFHGNSFPFLGGWGEIPAAVLMLIEILESEYRLFMKRRREQ